jgi:hypothetical protein
MDSGDFESWDAPATGGDLGLEASPGWGEILCVSSIIWSSKDSVLPGSLISSRGMEEAGSDVATGFFPFRNGLFVLFTSGDGGGNN